MLGHLTIRLFNDWSTLIGPFDDEIAVDRLRIFFNEIKSSFLEIA